MKNYDGIRKPLQKRSQQTAERVLEAFDALLRQKSLADITMQELSQESKAAISSIYARFDGKDAMLVALHEAITNKSVQLVSDLIIEFSANIRDTKDPIALIAPLLERYLSFAHDNKHIYRAIMLSNHQYAYERIIAQNHKASGMGYAFLSQLPGINREGLEERIDVAIRLLSSSFQQLWFFGDANPGRLSFTHKELAEHLANIITPYILQKTPSR